MSVLSAVIKVSVKIFFLKIYRKQLFKKGINGSFMEKWKWKIDYQEPITYPGLRGFLLFFISKFCDANRFLYFFYWHGALRAEKRKPLVATAGNLTFMPLAFDRRFWLKDIFNCSMSHMIGWIKYLWGWEWSVYVHLYGYGWRTFALSTDSLTREG